MPALIESARYVNESDAMLAFISPETHSNNLHNLGEFTVRRAEDDWREGSARGTLSGTLEAEGREYLMDLRVQFPGFLKSSFSRVMHREPKAIVYITVSEQLPRYLERTD